MGRQERRLPPPLPRRLHSPPLSQRHHRHQHSHLREVLHHPPTTQRRSARPHAHHSLSSAQPPSRPPRGSDIINRTTLYSFLLPVFYYSTSSAPPASSASSSPTSLLRFSPTIRHHQRSSKTAPPRYTAQAQARAGGSSGCTRRCCALLPLLRPHPPFLSSLLPLFLTHSLLIPFFYHLPPVVRRPHSAVSCSSAWEAPATWMQRKVSANCRAGASSRPCHLSPVIHCVKDGITLRSDRTYSCLRSLRHVGQGILTKAFY